MRERSGCCSTWPKPCPYHEGWADGKPFEPGQHVQGENVRHADCRAVVTQMDAS